jgi:hypothetical protein
VGQTQSDGMSTLLLITHLNLDTNIMGSTLSKISIKETTRTQCPSERRYWVASPKLGGRERLGDGKRVTVIPFSNKIVQRRKRVQDYSNIFSGKALKKKGEYPEQKKLPLCSLPVPAFALWKAFVLPQKFTGNSKRVLLQKRRVGNRKQEKPENIPL